MIFQSPTPWGTIDSLRERRLSPGPGIPAVEVARNQRERLFGAMVASVAGRGYAATRVADLVEISGVSRRSFYDLFPDKEACLLGTVEALHTKAAERIGSIPPGDWDERAVALSEGLVELVTMQPAAARLCLVDGYAAGRKVVATLDAGIDRFKAALRGLASESEQLATMPPQIIDVFVGSMLAVARDCLLGGREEELPGLMSQVLRLMLSYTPPPQPLNPSPRPPRAAEETIDAPDQGERILRAFVVLTAEIGYEKVTIIELVRRAGVAPTTFYANFSGKEDVMLAALDSAGAQMVASVLPAFRRNPDWVLGVRAAYVSLFGFLASRPALARVLLVESYAAGAKALAHRGLALQPLEVIFAEGRRWGPALSPAALRALEGGITELIARELDAGGAKALPSLASICAYVSLAPFIGADDACAATITEATFIESREERTADGRPIVRFKSTMEFFDAAEWTALSLTERSRISAEIGELVEADVRRAIDAGTFDLRVDRHLTRTPLRLDEQGWRELGDLYNHSLERELEIQEQCEARLASSGERPIEARGIHTLFEMPSPRTSPPNRG